MTSRYEVNKNKVIQRRVRLSPTPHQAQFYCDFK